MKIRRMEDFLRCEVTPKGEVIVDRVNGKPIRLIGFVGEGDPVSIRLAAYEYYRDLVHAVGEMRWANANS